MSWLVFNQFFSSHGLIFSTPPDIYKPVLAAVLAMIILVLSISAIGGFLMFGKMLLEFGT